ncbi:MAG: methionyl-tRNA formyltransferase [Spirochaetia bacterium]|nr:methionyl-tRNA formyltransferase [Spirochaetia bacterium]
MTRISFWGSPGISATLLEKIIQSKNILVEFVVTQEDKPRSYRGRQDEPTPVKTKADEYNIPVFTPKTLKKNADDFYSQISQFQVDVNVVFAYGKIIPERFFDLPKCGTINFHASLLPKLRGASPIEHALLHGEDKTGWTMQKMVEKLDAGDIFYTREVNIAWEDDFNSLLAKLMSELVTFSPSAINQFVSGELDHNSQNDKIATHCGKIDAQVGQINWFSSVFDIRNLSRAMSNRGGIYSSYNYKKCKLFPDLQVDRETILQSSIFSKQPGVISMITKDHIWISCNDNKSLPLNYIQPEGKKKLTASEFINGYRISAGDRFDAFSE